MTYNCDNQIVVIEMTVGVIIMMIVMTMLHDSGNDGTDDEDNYD